MPSERVALMELGGNGTLGAALPAVFMPALSFSPVGSPSIKP
jgi:hypothetical protein